MGILSEIDMMNRDAEDDAFEVSSDSETVDSFSEEFEPVEPQKPNQQAEVAEEARKKAEFDAAEVKRKAEWEAKQAQKKLREQQELDRLATMSDDDVMQASMNRVLQDTERLTRRNMKLCVMEDVQTECLSDPAFARLVMNPKKKMLNCFHYINRKAREYLEQEMKDNDENLWTAVSAAMCRTNSATSGHGSISVMPMPKRTLNPKKSLFPRLTMVKRPRKEKRKSPKRQRKNLSRSSQRKNSLPLVTLVQRRQ